MAVLEAGKEVASTYVGGVRQEGCTGPGFVPALLIQAVSGQASGDRVFGFGEGYVQALKAQVLVRVVVCAY